MFTVTGRQVVAILSAGAVAAVVGVRVADAVEGTKDKPPSPEAIFEKTVEGNGQVLSIVFDNRPENGVPPEALAQMHVKVSAQEEALAAKEYPVKFHTLTAGTIKTIRIRYFNKETWATEKQASEYVAGFLAHKSLNVFGFQIWSQGVGAPEIECIVEFTDDYRKKLHDEQKPCREGRLLIWNTECCFRDATGRWWFVDAFDYFHRSHPKGDRENAIGAKPK
jgi:hypothetical protein